MYCDYLCLYVSEGLWFKSIDQVPVNCENIMEIYWHISSHLFWKPSRGGLRGAGSLQARLPASWNYLHRRRGRHEGAQRGHTQHLRTSAGREWASSEPAPCGSAAALRWVQKGTRETKPSMNINGPMQSQWRGWIERNVGRLESSPYIVTEVPGTTDRGTRNGTLDAFLHRGNENVPTFPS